MQEAEEQGVSYCMLNLSLLNLRVSDTCRICSAPAEPDQPLFHPCKCSGTIRHIHQDWSVVHTRLLTFVHCFRKQFNDMACP